MEQARTLEEVARRRDRVQEWILKARKAVLSFSRGDGSFWRDSERAEENKRAELSGATTARSYMALIYADRCCGKLKSGDYEWRKDFERYLKNLKVEWGSNVTLELALDHGQESSKDKKINNFEVAHLADLEFVRAYIKRYAGQDLPPPRLVVASTPELHREEAAPQESSPAPHAADLDAHGSQRDEAVPQEGSPELSSTDLYSKLRAYFDNLAQPKDWSGRFPMQGESTGPHYFVNLHAARAYSILGATPEWAKPSIAPLRSYCLSQCFYAQRGLPHKVDAIQLILAGVACALYDDNPSVEIYEAVVDATQQLQQPSGNWPATHPIFLEEGKPWHITSHEMALCLTWLYHIPHITEASRRKILAMMERYFEQWVVRTYARAVGEHSGWYDDHHIRDNYVVGWATAIVCHFLANYYWILCHEVNRLVIESLGIADSAAHYRFEDTAPERARVIVPEGIALWWEPAPKKAGVVARERVAMWSDLPPYAWDPDETPEKIRDWMRKQWTDPSNEQVHTKDLASNIIAPILDASNARPAKDRCAGILYGPPGTRKTSLVDRVAEALRWPRVTVPGSVILSAGWNGLEARATEVFRQLKLLTNCVIFFDEYEEFFRTRGDEKEKALPAPAHVDNRSIAAFMTSGMLPRLQDLHDEQRCLVFLATNFESVLDKAVKRIGRFDFTLTIDHPKPSRVLEYIGNLEKVEANLWKEIVRIAKGDDNDARSAIEAVKKEVTTLGEGEGKDRPIPFKWVEDAVRRCAEKPSDAETIARRVLGQKLDMDAPPISKMI